MKAPFSQILETCQAIGRELSGVVFIGGVAVYLHSIMKERSLIVPEASHDADFMVSLSDYGVLKDQEEITSTPRLSKHQMFLNHVEFDIYVEKINRLVVPYDEVYANCDQVEGMNIACLEHLLVLKLEALTSRGHSSKGDKDRRDIAKIGLLLGRRAKTRLISPYMREALEKELREVAKSTVFYDLARKNAHEAKRARTAFAGFVKAVLGT